MSQRDLAAASGVHLQTLLDFEKGHRIPRGPTMQAIVRALQDAGIMFIPANGGGQGVRLREPETEPADSSAEGDGAEPSGA
jgi:transcriptional regulator with XRE-family HTH domain